MDAWTPSDWIELVKVVFLGIASICLPVSTAYGIIAAVRAKRSEQASLRNAVNIKRIEENTNSISERNQSIAHALGVTEGRAQELASGQARSNIQAALQAEIPMPVRDEKLVAAVERVGDVIKESANGVAKKK